MPTRPAWAAASTNYKLCVWICEEECVCVCVVCPVCYQLRAGKLQGREKAATNLKDSFLQSRSVIMVL